MIQDIESRGGFRGHELFDVGFMSGVFGSALCLLGVAFSFYSFWLIVPFAIVGFALIAIWVAIGMILNEREGLFRSGFDLGLEDRNECGPRHKR